MNMQSILEFLSLGALFLGSSVMLAGAIGFGCACWWWALGRARKCLYETYLLADLQVWASRNASKRKEPK